jgi:DNA polymerase III sliding clamp (beta) subunit (PCNA family)
MLTIETNLLNAALQCTAVKDIRHYQNGVHIYKPENNDFIYITGLDGHHFFIGRQLADCPAFEIIIPSETIKTAVKDAGKNEYIDLIIGDQNILGNQIFTPLEGIYPDISRIIPDVISVAGATNAPTKDVSITIHHRGHNIIAGTIV